MRWIALHLPRLSLESFAATVTPEAGAAAGGTPRPIALIEEHHVSAVDALGRADGVKVGMKRATALALSPRLLLGQADAGRDAAALLPVAHAALAFTPQVSLQEPPGAGPSRARPRPSEEPREPWKPAQDAKESPDTVLLEVQASLRLFGGEAELLARLAEATEPLGHAVAVAVATTPLAAALLARLDPPPRASTTADLPSTCAALERLPLWLIGPGREHWEAIQGMGLATVSDLRGLPRSGLARRFGEPFLADLDRAFGRRPDPREPIVLPPAFESRLELFARADTTEQVLHGSSVLVERLIAWLAARHAFVRRFRLLMQHEPRWRQDAAKTPSCTALEIALAEPSRDRAHLLVLLREQLAHVRLAAPTLELCLYAEDIARRPAPNTELFPTPRNEQEGLVRLVERLQARLGPERVQRLAPDDDHRPERACATRPADPATIGRGGAPVGGRRSAAAETLQRMEQAHPGRGAASAGSVAGSAGDPIVASSRPVWLLPEPEPLGESRWKPLLGGRPLALLAGPERIEAGWWDGALAERDYFVAEGEDGALVWIYRARLPLSRDDDASVTKKGWYLHGRFG